MTQWHLKSKRKPSGGIRTSRRHRDKLLAHKGGDAALTIVEPEAEKEKRSHITCRGKTSKVKQRIAKQAAVALTGGKKTVKAEILSVAENKANRLYTRRNIITKGCTIKVKLDGKEQLARVTSRPGQSGVVQAVLVENKG